MVLHVYPQTWVDLRDWFDLHWVGLTDLIDILEWGNNREIKSALEILYNPYHTHWLNVSFLRVGWRGNFQFWRELLWVRFWDRDGKGLGADLAAFLSSDESRYGEVGTNVVVWGGVYMGWARYSWKILAKVLWRGVSGYNFGHPGLIWWRRDLNYSHHKMQRLYPIMDLMMTMSLYNWEELNWYFQDLKNGNHTWGLIGWASWPKDEKNRGGMSRVAGLQMEKWTDCKLDLTIYIATGHKCHSDRASHNEPTPMAWCFLGCSDRLMELALNLYYWVWIESHHHHRPSDLRYDRIRWKICTAIPFNIENISSEIQEVGDNAWEKFNALPVPIKWPEVWGQEDSGKLMNLEWEDIMKDVRNSWVTNPGRDPIEKELILFYMGIDQSNENVASFFKEYDTMVEYLAKWKGSHELNDHEAWRKIPGTNNQSSRWLDVERGACQLEEVWSSKNRDPMKNIFMQKVNFMQNFFSSRPTITQLGFSEFKVGHDKNKDRQIHSAPKENIVSRIDSLYADLVAKESRLKEIAININKMDKNTALLNSILGMKSCKLRKFSAKVNDHGIVTIDENMVQSEDNPVENSPTRNEIPWDRLVDSALNRDRRLGEAHLWCHTMRILLDKKNMIVPLASKGWNLGGKSPGSICHFQVLVMWVDGSLWVMHEWSPITGCIGAMFVGQRNRNSKFSNGNMNPSLSEPDLIEKPPDPLVSPVSEQNSGRRSSSRLALNALSRKSKDVSGSPVGGKGHTSFVKLNIEDFVNEATANAFPKSSNSLLVGDGMTNRVEGEGPIGDDFGIKFMDNGVAMAIDQPINREDGLYPRSVIEGLTNPAHGQISGTHLLNPSGVNDGFVMVTRKHRRPKVKILSNSLGQNRGKKGVNNKGPKSGGTPIESGPSSSSDPIIQKKMGELHQKSEKSKMPNNRVLNDVTNSHKKPTHPYAPYRKPSPSCPIPANSQPQPRNSAQPKPSGKKVTAHKPQSVSTQSPVSRVELTDISTNNPFASLDVDMPYVDKIAGTASDVGNISEADKLYEFSPETIANVLQFNPSKLTVPRIHDLSPDPDEPVIMDVVYDEEVPDFNITNAQKQAICNSLEKYCNTPTRDRADVSLLQSQKQKDIT
ncbi:hypothetical protein L1987_84585 [Smallanthus sonchifolius]|uniref:Uncharacterized protein n=1 Tax=Smallanthus sonchifolius TaxID=185202 RepID=A0ACB8XYA2_9ASTR|nr:hypothetical protein L1987_84585 [Smallanthus sonchifolius]